MRYIRFIIISFVVLLLLLTGISFMIPKHMRIARTVSIAAPKDSVMAQIRDVTRWKNWYPGLESTKPYLINGEVRGAIFDDSDPSNPVYIAIGEQKENEVTARFVPRKLNAVINGWVVADGPAPGTVTLQWYMNFNLRWYPWEKFSSLILEKTYGPPMVEGLNNVKNSVEN
jgi:hypothetical protein